MSFNQDNFASVGASSSDSPSVYSYKTDDILDSIVSSGYFISKSNQLEKGDIIFIQASDGFAISSVGVDTSSASISQQSISNRVVVNSGDDFPDPVAGVIPLLANTEYYIGSSSVDIGSNKLSTQSGTAIRGSLGASVITSTTTGALINGGDGGLTIIDGVVLSATSGSIFDFTDTTQGLTTLVISDIVGLCDSIGSFDDVAGVNVSNAQFDCGTTGADFSNTVDLLSFRQVSFNSSSATFVGIDLGTAVSSTFELEDLAMNCVAGSVGISGATDSANISAGSIASISGCEFLGGMTDLSGITIDDIRFSFRDNSPTQDTLPTALISFSGNTTETVITAVDTPVLVTSSGSALVEASFYETTLAGRISYIGERDIKAQVDVFLSLQSAGGSTIDVTAYLVLNGTAIASSAVQVEISGNKPQTVNMPWQALLSKDDYLEIHIENNTNTTNIIAGTGILRVR